MTREEQIDWLCRLRADLNNGVIFTPWNKEFTEALNDVLEQESVLDKIREQMKDYLRGVEITLEVLVEGDPLRPKMEGAKDTLEECLEIIDKAESEEI